MKNVTHSQLCDFLCTDKSQPVSEPGLSLPGISWSDLTAALTDPDKRFEFPIKPFETDLTWSTKLAIVGSAVIIGGSMIYLATQSKK